MARPKPPYDAGFTAALDDPPAPEDREQRREDIALVVRSYAPGSAQRLFYEGYAAALDAMADA